jgi:hypothetical protein
MFFTVVLNGCLSIVLLAVLVGVTGEFYSSSTVSDHLWRRLLVSGKFPAQSDNFLVVLIIFGDCYGLFRRIF